MSDRSDQNTPPALTAGGTEAMIKARDNPDLTGKRIISEGTTLRPPPEIKRRKTSSTEEPLISHWAFDGKDPD